MQHNDEVSNTKLSVSNKNGNNPLSGGSQPLKNGGNHPIGANQLIVSLAVFIVVIALANGLFADLLGKIFPMVINAVIAVTGVIIVTLVIKNMNRNSLTPMEEIRTWANRIHNGQLWARISNRRFAQSETIANLNSLGETVENLSLSLKNQMREQNECIERKNRALEIIYDVAANINDARDLEELLTRFLHTLKDVVNAKAAAVRLLSEDGQMKLLANIGIDENIIEREHLLPVNQCTCGIVCENGKIMYKTDLATCATHIGVTSFFDKKTYLIAVPLQYRNKILGVYNLFMDSKTLIERSDIDGLLTNIGRHLGMAIDKARLDNEAYRLSIMEERTSLAHELHDSLAQTLASLRFQVRVLDDTLHTSDESAVWQEVEKIENSLDEAHIELRELITHFRAPIDKRGLLPAIEHLVERFRKQSNIHIYLQQNWESSWLPAETEVQIVHIVQEALTNIRKHSEAQNVRVLMRSTHNGEYRILIEDDGVGISNSKEVAPLIEHIGLNIMEERARRIHGELRIESDPGEGTQVSLSFQQAAS